MWYNIYLSRLKAEYFTESLRFIQKHADTEGYIIGTQ